MLTPQSKILVAGSETLAGSALVELLQDRSHFFVKATTQELLDSQKVASIFEKEKPEFVFLVAGKSGGILANQKYPATLMQSNLLATTLVIEACWKYQVRKMLFLASSCIYPKRAPQPMNPDYLFISSMEPTSQSYSLAKLAGLELCQAYQREHKASYITAIAADPFGPGIAYESEDAHVVGALLAKMHDAKEKQLSSVLLWGTGTPVRDLIFSQDLGEGCLFLMNHYEGNTPINLTANCPLSIAEIAQLIKQVVGFDGKIEWDTQRPDGSPSKILDASKIQALGWKSNSEIREALQKTYEDYLKKKVSEIVYA